MTSETTPQFEPSPFEGSGYWHASRQPLTSLVFVLPLLCIYEAGVLVLGTAAVRNGADVWLRQLLDLVGFGQYFLLPLLCIAALLAWHHTTRQPWRVSSAVVGGMYLECAVLGLVLVGLAHVIGPILYSLAWQVEPAQVRVVVRPGGVVEKAVGYLGAGIYEEVLFRLLLLPLLFTAIGYTGATPGKRLAGAVIISSLMFSAAHHVGGGESFALDRFVFRFFAGAFFAVLYMARGFGIAAGSHALYDIFVGLP